MSPRKNNRPTLDEYFGMEADAYGNSQWMARNQIKTTEQALQFMESPELGGNFTDTKEELIFLDIGCGTGYSSHTILGIGARVIGLDFSEDMLSNCPSDFDLHLIHGDMRYLPFRSA
ncbi:MAG: class I SAM-dependent methyltransferase, partial [Promethearchaeota archaeon]